MQQGAGGEKMNHRATLRQRGLLNKLSTLGETQNKGTASGQN